MPTHISYLFSLVLSSDSSDLKRLLPYANLQNVNFGALFLNYFGSQSEENLKDIIQSIPIDSVINYLNALYIRHRTQMPDGFDSMKVSRFGETVHSFPELIVFYFKGF